MLAAARELEHVEVRSLYDLYPAFDIDIQAEQHALRRAELVIWQHPLYWYSVPGLMKQWFDKVLARGFAFGEGGTALRGKRCFWVATTGGSEADYSSQGMHAYPFEKFVPVVEQTARFCGMVWEEPLIVHSAHQAGQRSLEEMADKYRSRLQLLLGPEGDAR